MLNIVSSYPKLSNYLGLSEKGVLSCLNKLWNKIVQVGSLPALLKEPGRNEHSPLADLFNTYFPNLDECACEHAPESVRDEMTQMLVQQVTNVNGIPDSLSIVSVGSGGCLRELILSIHLYEIGVRKLNFLLLDPEIGVTKVNWKPSRKITSQRRLNLALSVESLSRFFHLFLPALEVNIEYHWAVPEKFVEGRTVDPVSIAHLVDINSNHVLQDSYKWLRKGGAIGPGTLVGWTRLEIDEKTHYLSRAYVKISPQKEDFI